MQRCIDARGRNALRDRRRLIGLNIDHEPIWRVGRCGFAPGVDQVGASDGQQQQRHQPDRERNELYYRGDRSPLHGGNRKPPRNAELGR